MIEDLTPIVDALANYTVLGDNRPGVVGASYTVELSIEEIVEAIHVLGERSWALSLIFANITRAELRVIVKRLTQEQIRRLFSVNERFKPDIRAKEAELDAIVRAAEGRE